DAAPHGGSCRSPSRSPSAMPGCSPASSPIGSRFPTASTPIAGSPHATRGSERSSCCPTADPGGAKAAALGPPAGVAKAPGLSVPTRLWSSAPVRFIFGREPKEGAMGEDLRDLLEEGVRVAYGAEPELVRFVSRYHVSPSIAQVLKALRATFRSSVEALA